MKILIYADPSCLYDVFLPSIQVMRDHLLRFCGRALLASGKVEIRAVVSEITRWQAGGADELEGIGLIEFSYADLCRIFSGCRSLDAMQLAFFNAQADDSQKRALADWFARRLGTWQPDVVLVFPTQPTLLREIFPQALCLTMENGIFSRFPFPRSLRFEPVDFMNGFPNRYREQIRNFQIGPEEREAVRAFCHRLTELLVGLCPRCAELEALRSRFRHLVLCPVPASNRYEEAAKDDQILWLMEVMEGVPSDIGVLITFHDNVDSQLNERTVAFLRARYPNLVAFDVGRRSLPSAFYFPFVDAILNCETMTGTQGMLVCPRIIALDRTYSAWMADGVGLASLPDVLARPAPDRSAMIYWYLTHFTVMEGRFDDADWYYGFLSGLLERYRRDGVTFGLFARTEAFSTVADQVLGSCERCLANIREGHRRRHVPLYGLSRKLGRWMSRAGANLTAFAEGGRTA